jgi:hypothetical protein
MYAQTGFARIAERESIPISHTGENFVSLAKEVPSL